MITEKKIDLEINSLPPLVAHQKSEELIPENVDINILLNRARKIKHKENLTNLIFAGLALTLIFITGVILSF